MSCIVLLVILHRIKGSFLYDHFPGKMFSVWILLTLNLLMGDTTGPPKAHPTLRTYGSTFRSTQGSSPMDSAFILVSCVLVLSLRSRSLISSPQVSETLQLIVLWFFSDCLFWRDFLNHNKLVSMLRNAADEFKVNWWGTWRPETLHRKQESDDSSPTSKFQQL